MGQGQPGLDLDAVNFIRRRDVAVVGAGNSGIEVIPFDREIFSSEFRLLST
jgi:hypothetical protein